MKGRERRSAAEEKHLRWKEEEEQEGWRCRKHPFQPRYGVCPVCLRDRLVRLCPDCANARPSCACAQFSSSSTSSSSSSSFSCLSFPADLPRSGTTRPTRGVSSLIEREPSFQRSGSVGVVHVPRSRSIAAATGGRGSGEERRRGWAGLWPFASARNESAAEGWKWHFPSPMNLLRYRKSEASGRGRRCTALIGRLLILSVVSRVATEKLQGPGNVAKQHKEMGYNNRTLAATINAEPNHNVLPSKLFKS